MEVRITDYRETFYGPGLLSIKDLFSDQANKRPGIDNHRREVLQKLQREANTIVAVYKDMNADIVRHKKLISLDSFLDRLQGVSHPDIWFMIYKERDIKKLRNPMNRKALVKKLIDNLPRQDHVLTILQTCFALIKEDEFSYRDMDSVNPSIIRMFSQSKKLIRIYDSSEDMNLLLPVYITMVRGMQSRIFEALENLRQLFSNLENRITWYHEMAVMFREISSKYRLRIKTFKITGSGIMTDDGLPHNASDTKAGGVINIECYNGSTQAHFNLILQNIKTVEHQYRAATNRLKIISDSGYCNYKFSRALIKTLATALANKFFTDYSCICNYIRSKVARIKDLETPTPETWQNRRELENAMAIQFPLTIDIVFKYSPDVAGWWIANLKNPTPTIRTDEYLFNGPYSTKVKARSTTSFNYFDDRNYAYSMREMLINYLSNMIYVLTHSTFSQGASPVQVPVYRLKIKDEEPVLKTVGTFTSTSFRITRDLGSLLGLFLTKFDNYSDTGFIDADGDYVIFLKATTHTQDSMKMPYLEVKEVGTSRVITSLEMIIEFLLFLVEQNESLDIYFGSNAALNQSGLTIRPHLPYKYFGRVMKSGSLLFNAAPSDVMGVNDMTYSVPNKFHKSTEFDIKGTLYIFSLKRSLIAYVSSRMTETIANYWFVRKIFYSLEELRLEINPETVHLAGNFVPHPDIVNFYSLALQFTGKPVALINMKKTADLQKDLVTMKNGEYFKRRPKVAKQSETKEEEEEPVEILHRMPRTFR
jgi:hypothetical protein